MAVNDPEQVNLIHDIRISPDRTPRDVHFTQAENPSLPE